MPMGDKAQCTPVEYRAYACRNKYLGRYFVKVPAQDHGNGALSQSFPRSRQPTAEKAFYLAQSRYDQSCTRKIHVWCPEMYPEVRRRHEDLYCWNHRLSWTPMQLYPRFQFVVSNGEHYQRVCLHRRVNDHEVIVHGNNKNEVHGNNKNEVIVRHKHLYNYVSIPRSYISGFVESIPTTCRHHFTVADTLWTGINDWNS